MSAAPMKAVIALACLVALGCEKKDPPAPPAPPPSASAAPAVVDAGPQKNEWSGSYTAEAATLYIPDGAEWKGVKFRGEDAGDGLGDGTMRLEISKDNVVSGEGSGALGAFVIAGTVADGVITFSVGRKDPTDMGFTGTGRASVGTDKLEGSMRVSKATGNVIREATFSLHR